MLKIEITNTIKEIAVKHAQERIKYEYDRFRLPKKDKISMIEIGCIGELVFGEFLKQLNINFVEEFQAGEYDSFDFMIKNKILDIKTSGYKTHPIQEKLNMLYNIDQYERGLHKNYSFSVQIFINGFDRLNYNFDLKNCTEAYIAGYIPYSLISAFPIYKYTYTPAYKIPLNELKDINSLINSI